MARRSETIVWPHEGRDFGKVFIIQEMDADKAEAWAMEAMFAIGAAGIDLPPDYSQMGTFGFLQFGVERFIRAPWEKAKPLLDALMTCVKMQSPTTGEPRDIIPGEIEEVATLMRLKQCVINLHMDFFPNGAGTTAEDTPPQPQRRGPNIEISPAP